MSRSALACFKVAWRFKISGISSSRSTRVVKKSRQDDAVDVTISELSVLHDALQIHLVAALGV
jgi:hypothetical protein